MLNILNQPTNILLFLSLNFISYRYLLKNFRKKFVVEIIIRWRFDWSINDAVIDYKNCTQRLITVSTYENNLFFKFEHQVKLGLNKIYKNIVKF